MRPSRELFRQADQTYFATFQTARRQCFFRNERWSALLLATLLRYQEQLGLHDFVIMPDHLHLLLSPQVPLERAVQLIKGGFSFQARREFQWHGDIWQVGLSDHRIRDIDDWDHHCEYIRKNALSKRSEGKAACGKNSSMSLHPLPLWLKPQSLAVANGGAEAPPLQSRDIASSTKAEVLPIQSRDLLSSAKAEVSPLQNSSSFDRDLEAWCLQTSPSSTEENTDLHYAKDAQDLFRKLGI